MRAAAEDCTDNGSVFCEALSTFSEQAAKIVAVKRLNYHMCSCLVCSDVNKISQLFHSGI